MSASGDDCPDRILSPMNNKARNPGARLVGSKVAKGCRVLSLTEWLLAKIRILARLEILIQSRRAIVNYRVVLPILLGVVAAHPPSYSMPSTHPLAKRLHGKGRK